MKKHTVKLMDSDGDGIILFSWDNEHPGIVVELVDMFDNDVVGTFYKDDLVKTLRKVLEKLDNT